MSPPPSPEYEKFKRNLLIGGIVVLLGIAGFYAWLKRQEAEALREQVANAEHAKKGGKHSAHATADEAGSADGQDAAMSGDETDKKSKGHKHERADGTIRPKTKDTVGWRAYAELAGNPQYEKLSLAQNRALVGRTYGVMFKSMNLPAATQSSLQDLLAQRQQAMTDAVVAARENGLKSKTAPAEFSAATAAAIAPVESQIRQLIGDAAYGQYQQYQTSIPERNLIGELQQKLSAGAAPLSDDTANQLLQALQQAKPADAAGLGTHSLLAGGGIAKITDQTLATAQNVLTPAQLQALVEIQQERADEKNMENLMKGKNPAGTNATATSGSPTVGIKPPKNK